MDQPTAFTSSLPLVDLSGPKLGRTPGKAHKATRSAIRRSYLSAFAKSPFQKRKELEKRREAVRGVEREMKQAKDAEADRCGS